MFKLFLLGLVIFALGVQARSFKTLPRNNYKVETEARAGLVVDLKTGRILYQKNSFQVLPVASLTKLMSALIILENRPDWNKIVEIKKEDEAEGARLKLDENEKILLKDLFYASLVGSANNGIKALVRALNFKEEDFVKKMNEKAKKLNLKNTFFKEPTGLSPENVSTCREIVLLAKAAFERREIRDALSEKFYDFKTVADQSSSFEERWLRVKNADKLLGRNLGIVASKTGYIEESGFSLISKVKRGRREVMAVILGAKDNDSRFLEMEKILNFVFSIYR